MRHLTVISTSDKILIVRVLAITTTFQLLKFESPFRISLQKEHFVKFLKVQSSYIINTILERYYHILNIYVLISHIMTKSPDVNLELSAPELKE